MKTNLSCPLLALLLGSANAFADGNPFLESYIRAQAVIEQTVAAYGGIDKLNGIDSLLLRLEGITYQRHQSPSVEPPFATIDTWTEIAFDKKAGALVVENGGPYFVNRTIIDGETTQQLDPLRGTYAEAAEIDVDAHWIHRIVPALLAKKLHDRARSVLWIGESEVEGRQTDALNIAWDDGTVYVIHVDRQTHLLSQYDILFPDPVAGDAVFESVFTEYKPVDGIPFPMRLTQAIAGDKTFDVRVTAIELNQDISAYLEIPADYRRIARAPAPESTMRKIADGVYLGNGNYQNLFVEMDDYVIAVDAGGGTASVRANIDEIKTLIPDKPIRYAVLTHHHTDHSGGVDALVAEGARVVTLKENEALVKTMVNDREIHAANYQAAETKRPTFLFIENKYIFDDGGRQMELYHLPNEHAQDYLVAFLPAEGILYGADVFVLPATGPVPRDNSQFASFYDQLDALGIEVRTVVNSHGRIGTIHDLHAWASND